MTKSPKLDTTERSVYLGTGADAGLDERNEEAPRI